MAHLDLKIEGMTCNSCSNAITKRLSKFDFTSNIDVNWEAGTGKLDINDPVEENKGKIVTAINQLGYKVVN